jgi:hypothetical protein
MPRMTPEIDLCDYDEDGRPQTRRGVIRDAVFTTVRGAGFMLAFAGCYAFIICLFSI